VTKFRTLGAGVPFEWRYQKWVPPKKTLFCH